MCCCGAQIPAGIYSHTHDCMASASDQNSRRLGKMQVDGALAAYLLMLCSGSAEMTAVEGHHLALPRPPLRTL